MLCQRRTLAALSKYSCATKIILSMKWVSAENHATLIGILPVAAHSLNLVGWNGRYRRDLLAFRIDGRIQARGARGWAGPRTACCHQISAHLRRVPFCGA